MEQANPVLIVGIISGHVGHADSIIGAVARPPHHSNYVVAGGKFGYLRTHLLNYAKTFVSENQEVVTWRSSAILPAIDFTICAVQTYTEDAYQHSTAVRRLLQAGYWQVC